MPTNKMEKILWIMLFVVLVLALTLLVYTEFMAYQ